MSGRDKVRALLTELVEARGIYWVAKQLGKTYTQISRMLTSGRCQPDEYSELQTLRATVSRETSQNVSNVMLSQASDKLISEA
jgi:hypothetical protein